eukprot:6174696-Pleurochrysis_carterae.AAC.1
MQEDASQRHSQALLGVGCAAGRIRRAADTRARCCARRRRARFCSRVQIACLSGKEHRCGRSSSRRELLVGRGGGALFQCVHSRVEPSDSRKRFRKHACLAKLMSKFTPQVE